ncbi:MAG TPA: SET domain-containing protein-lysine N-methyltransferase [Spirochaetota bacterium]|nr:SET domain-containing protein-lysine N-methyltransferase [Spirochaetota bacterium]HPI91398.1 SET domain-containing protein-lysine N-methyltransferase [Spirochaetota bacterium]HPR47081.1 SET domain-containing protein-lysine N-methyltransferase [Spirochaetota bacterium]
MINKRHKFQDTFGIYTSGPIGKGRIIFTAQDWTEDEKLGWMSLTVDQVNQLSPESRTTFLHYSYDIDFNRIMGTFDWSLARNITNFINHSCDPNMMFDGNNNVIARRTIAPGEELTLDYGTFVVTVDQDFICCCGSPGCRRIITRDDWKQLISRYGLCFPTFMHETIKRYLETPAEEPVA